jgi:hypothetical protein
MNFPFYVRTGDDSGSNFEYGMILNAIFVLSKVSGPMQARNGAATITPLNAGDPIDL